MGTNQQFSLRWNNYSNHITNALDDLRTEDELTDVTLCAEGGKVRAHKLLLSACSTFFRETFRENPCQHPVIILKGVSFLDLQAVVTFMYNGQVNVSQDRLPCFLQTAEILQVKGLTDMNDKNDIDDVQEPIMPKIPNMKVKKRVGVPNSNSDGHLSETAQRPPTPKRRKVIPPPPTATTSLSVPAAETSAGSGSAYNSPGPSSASASVSGSTNANPVGGVIVGDRDTDSNSALDYPPGTEQGMLKFEEPDGDPDALGEGEEDYYGNSFTDDGLDGFDDSMQDDLKMFRGDGSDQGALGVGTVEEPVAMVIQNGSFQVDVIPITDNTRSNVPSSSETVEECESYPTVIYDGRNCPNVSGTFEHQHVQSLQLQQLESNIPLGTSIFRKKRTKITSSAGHMQTDDPLADPLAPAVDWKPQVSPFVGDPVKHPETGEILFPCLKCGKTYKTKSSLDSHVKIHEGFDNTCPLCSQTMSRQRDLKRHIATIHRGLLMQDGTITYPPNIEELVPGRYKSKPDGASYS